MCCIKRIQNDKPLKLESILIESSSTVNVPGKLPYISHIGTCRPEEYIYTFNFFLVLKRVYILPILVWNRVSFSMELRECMNVFVISVPK